MISPSSLMKPELLISKNSIIKFDEMPEYDEPEYDIANPKEFEKYIKAIEKDVRGSFEYREFLKYLKNYFDMWESGSFDESLAGADSGVRKEVHHTPFSLYDIVIIVYNKRAFYHEDLSVPMVSKEVMELHYKQLVGLYPLTVTEHQLVHNGFLFIPTYKVFGRYDLFKSLYSEFIEPEMKDTLDEIEEYSKVAFNEKEQKKLLSQTNIYLDTSGVYSLPLLDNLKLAIEDRMSQIKQNAYTLPIFEEETTESRTKSNNEFIQLISFDEEPIRNNKEMIQVISFY